jgi:Tfp pilus assembly protein PilF
MSMRANAYDNLGDVDAALRDHNEAIRLNPENPNTRDNRGRFLQGRELGDFGEADFAKAREIRAKVK